MTWIKPITPEADDKLRRAIEAQPDLYPIQYATPIHPSADNQTAEIVASHSLIPDALHHAFSRALRTLPLSPRRRSRRELCASL